MASCRVEMSRFRDIDTAWERMLRNDVKYRFAIDRASPRDAGDRP